MTVYFPIETSRLRIRPFRMADVDDLYGYHSRPEVARYLAWGPRSRDEVKALVENRRRTTTLVETGDSLVLAAELLEINKVIGDLYLMYRSREHKQGEIGFIFNPEYHGRGFATEASQVMLAIGFTEFEFHRIYGRCDARNVGSFRVMERLGMRREAHFVQSEFFKGEWSDELFYAILQTEWEEQFSNQIRAQTTTWVD